QRRIDWPRQRCRSPSPHREAGIGEKNRRGHHGQAQHTLAELRSFTLPMNRLTVQRSTSNVERSKLDVECWTLFFCTGSSSQCANEGLSRLHKNIASPGETV